LLIFNVVLGKDLREFRSKIPIHFDAMGPGGNQGQDGSSHVVGGTTEYLSTMRRFWIAVEMEDGQAIKIRY